jgi:hypothetical protein
MGSKEDKRKGAAASPKECCEKSLKINSDTTTTTNESTVKDPNIKTTNKEKSFFNHDPKSPFKRLNCVQKTDL